MSITDVRLRCPPAKLALKGVQPVLREEERSREGQAAVGNIRHGWMIF